MSLASEEFRPESRNEPGAADGMDVGEGPDILEGNKSGQLGEFLVREARIIEQNIWHTFTVITYILYYIHNYIEYGHHGTILQVHSTPYAQSIRHRTIYVKPPLQNI